MPDRRSTERRAVRWAVVQPWVTLVARLALAVVFVLSGWPKFADTEGTVRAVRAYELLPEALVRPMAYGLPVLELLLAAVLILGIGVRVSGMIVIGLMAMFMLGISSAWARGLSIDCGCFGTGGQVAVDPVPGYIRDLIRDFIFLALGAVLVRWPRSRLSLDAALATTQPPAADAALSEEPTAADAAPPREDGTNP